MTNQQVEQPLIRILTYLYSVLVALALVAAIRFLVDEAPATNPVPNQVPGQAYLIFGALIVTMIPFFHGTMTHVAKTYQEDTTHQAPTRNKILQPTLDLLVLLSQGAILYAMASTLQFPRAFLGWFVVLLVTDVVFTVLARLALAGTDKPLPPAVWGWSNLTVLILLVVLLWVPKPEWVFRDFGGVIAFGLAALRSVVDYGFARDYYFDLR